MRSEKTLQTSAKKEQHTTVAVIKRSDAKKQIVYAEVYAPYTTDTYGDMMLPEDIEKMAHEFLQRKDLDKSVDTNHDNVPNGSYPIESFIARKGDPDFTEGAWVVGVKVPDQRTWDKIERGELNGFSMESLVKMLPAVAEVYIQSASIGRTEEAEDHQHFFFLELDADGRVKSGRTSMDYGHAHEIRMGTATESAYGHSHRFFI